MSLYRPYFSWEADMRLGGGHYTSTARPHEDATGSSRRRDRCAILRKFIQSYACSWARWGQRGLQAVVWCCVLTACGAGGSEDGSVVKDAVPDTNAVATPWSTILKSPAYTGTVVVMFVEGTGVRLVNGQLTSLSGTDLTDVHTALARVSNLHIHRGLSRVTDEEIARARVAAQARGGHLHDWSLLFRLRVPDPSEAEQLLRDLSRAPSVHFVHPVVTGTPTGTVTPDLTGQQGYVQAGTGGLNVVAAWGQGLSGTGVTVVDIEDGWNFDHEDLPIDVGDWVWKLGEAPTLPVTDPGVQHGTAVIGVIAGKDNGSGVRGIASGATVKVVQTDALEQLPYIEFLLTELIAYLNGSPSAAGIQPGAVVLEEMQSPGPTTPAAQLNGTAAGCDGCIPVEAYDNPYWAIEDAVQNGIVVVEAAGNGGLDLASDAATVDPFGGWEPDLGKDSTGAIMVGASTGADMQKKASSNCGKRVDVYAWGKGVVTTGYGDLSGGTDPNQWYTATFGGTSAATAQIAGIAALLQEAVRQQYANQPPWKLVYLNAAQMREVLVQAGAGHAAGGDKGCPIGVQPDVGKALQLLKENVVQPTIEDKNLHLCLTEGWCDAWCQSFPVGQIPNGGVDVYGQNVCNVGTTQQWCEAQDPATAPLWCVNYVSAAKLQGHLAAPQDLDGDGRADLITWGREQKWYIDRSMVGASGDHYGGWDLVLTPAPLPAGMYFPVVGDYNTDGKADLALYNSATGQWYIAYTTDAVLAGQWHGWDRIIDYSKDPQWRPYSRPVPGDYDGADQCEWWQDAFCAPYGGENPLTFDRWWDPALATPEGQLLIDLTTSTEGQSTGSVAGAFDQHVAYLSAAQLQAAPGWAYLPEPETVYPMDFFLTLLFYGVPPGLPEPEPFGPVTPYIGDFSVFWLDPAGIAVHSGLSPKQSDGKWTGTRDENGWWVDDQLDFGGLNCRPILADYDGDGYLDRAVVCPTEWRIAYSGTQFTVGADGLRHVLMNGTKPVDPLPGYVYPGGAAYDTLVGTYNQYHFGCNGPNASQCTIFDLTTYAPPPVGPYLPVCLKYWATQPMQCLNY